MLAGCSLEGPGSTSTAPAPAPSTQAGTEATGSGDASSAPAGSDITGPDDVPAPDSEDEEKSIAFFGFARANSFANGTFAGIEEYAEEHNATAEFFDGNFDGQTQASQMQDAVTSGRFDVFVVQANDGTAVMPPIENAIAQGISVVIEFTPVGTKYDTIEPQVDGTITLIDVPTTNGVALADMAIKACAEAGSDPCEVAYLEGARALPLDNARTEAFRGQLESQGSIEIVASVEGGYTSDTGRAAMQDVLQANPEVDVVVGSSQAIMGAKTVAGDAEIRFIGNGGSRQAIDAVKSGDWFATYCLPQQVSGQTTAALGLAHARGAEVPMANSSTNLSPVKGLCLQDNTADVEGDYDE